MIRIFALCMPLWLIGVLPMLGGCSGTFENVLTTSLQGDRAFGTSLYGPVGITMEFRKADAEEIRRLRARAAAIQSQ